MKRSKVRAVTGGAGARRVRAAPSVKKAVVEEAERLRAGGELDESLLRRMSLEARALFDVTLIDALIKWPREDRHRLRSMLIKHGYDEYCARRIMKEDVADSIRASTLLNLLRPQSQVNANGQGCRIKTGDDGESNSKTEVAEDS